MGAPDFFEVAARESDAHHVASALNFPPGTVIHSSMCLIHPHHGVHGWYVHALLNGDPQYWVRLVGGPYETEAECIAAIRELTGMPPLPAAVVEAEVEADGADPAVA